MLASAAEVEAWLEGHRGEAGWHVEEFVDGEQHHVNAVVVDGTITPVQVGRYLGPLLGLPRGRRLGGVLLASDDPLAPRAPCAGPGPDRAPGGVGVGASDAR